MDMTPTATAIIAVHMQNDIAGTGAFAPIFGEQVAARDVISRVAALTSAARDAGSRIVFTRVAWQPDYSDLDANSPLLQMVVQMGALQEGSTGADLVSEAGAHENDTIHTHRRIGGFTPDLADDLRAAGVDTLVFCGVATNASVEGTARQASDEGFTVLVAEDACAAATAEAHQASIESMGLIGTAVSSDDVVAALAGGSR